MGWIIRGKTWVFKKSLTRKYPEESIFPFLAQWGWCFLRNIFKKLLQYFPLSLAEDLGGQRGLHDWTTYLSPHWEPNKCAHFFNGPPPINPTDYHSTPSHWLLNMFFYFFGLENKKPFKKTIINDDTTFIFSGLLWKLYYLFLVEKKKKNLIFF